MSAEDQNIKNELSKLAELIDDFVNKSNVLDIKEFDGKIGTSSSQLYKCPDGNGGYYWSEVPCS